MLLVVCSFVVVCRLSVDGCWLLVLGCWLLVVSCWSLVVGCLRFGSLVVWLFGVLVFGGSCLAFGVW